MIAEIEGLHKEEQLKEEPDEKPEETVAIDSARNLEDTDETSLNIENPTEVVKSEPGKEKDTTAPTIEFAESNYQEGSRQIIEKDELASENQELKSQKNGFLGGLFRRKK